mgnify:CR=1 FL=1
MPYEKFHYNKIDQVITEAEKLGVNLPLSENMALLSRPLNFCGLTASNRLAIQPMEGCDGTADGAPDELTVRRYHRFARSGAGLIWAEATAILPEGRANPRQLMITEQNVDEFKRLVDDIRQIAVRETGVNPILVLQLTHSGRYSKPEGKPAPLIAQNNPLFENDKPINQTRIVTDEYIKQLPEVYARAAKLAARAGFDGVDIKSCHGYLMSELLASHTRKGEYGGCFENRTRLLIDSVSAAKAATSAFVTSRLNLHDGFPLPYGWGVGEDGRPDMAEPVRLVEILHHKLNFELLDFTIGNPYVNPHVNRPYDSGPYIPDEHPFEGLARMCECISAVKNKFPDLKVIGSGFSYLRQFSANLAAGMVETGGADIAGFGRMSFAYPTFACDILKNGSLDTRKCCIACGKCSELMRAGRVAGCAIRDRELYLPIFNYASKSTVSKV